MNMLTHWTTDKFYSLLNRTHLSLFPEKSALCSFLFHSLFRNENEIRQGTVDPQQGTTVAHFREFVDYFLNKGYHFTSPEHVVDGLEPEKNYVLITFDDGYYNNHLSLPVLQEYSVPATFFISANHVLENKCFWWDVVYRERKKRGASLHQLHTEYSFLKKSKNEEIECYLKSNFGARAIKPIGDIDRPFTPAELNAFSKNSLITIGNHTFNHAILTNYTGSEIKAEIAQSQKQLVRITGREPSMIAYPNGNFSEEVITISKEAGLQSGITVQAHKNYLPLKTRDNHLFRLNRFTLWGNECVRRQCEFVRTEIRSKRIKRKFNAWNKALCHRNQG